jgi:CDGSH-type Zn-finger protein
VTNEPKRAGARITVYPNGPLIVRGDFVLDDLDAGPLPSGRAVALCRCGRSATKPLCDGSHHHGRRRERRPPTATQT